jgi:hypothetical protein
MWAFWSLTISVKRPRDQRRNEPPAAAAVRFNTWLDDPRTESRTTSLWNLYPAQSPRKDPSSPAEGMQRRVGWRGQGALSRDGAARRVPGARFAWPQGTLLPQPPRAHTVRVTHAATSAGARADGAMRGRGIMPRQTSR